MNLKTLSKRIHPTDLAVGHRIRAQRLAKGISQSELAGAIGVTFQQIQKYERGTNRVSASKLFDIANALSVEIVAFFNGLSRSPGAAAGAFDLTRMTRTDVLIVNELLSLPEGPFKTSILGFLRAISGRDVPAHEESRAG